MKEIFKELNLSLLKGIIKSYDDFKLFTDFKEPRTKSNMDTLSNGSECLIKKAEAFLNEPYPELPAALFLEFKRNGNRVNFEKNVFKRREMIYYLLFAELIEKKNRFTDKLLDGVWMTLEESTWLLPAHNGHAPHSSFNCPLPYCYTEKVDYIDLFSAETAALLAWVYYLTEDIFDTITPVIRERILHEITRRTITPFFEYDHWWTSLSGNPANNWNPWIVSNMLTVCALCIKDQSTRENFVLRAMKMLDGFTKYYPDDGGCDEGPSYWTVAGASYFDCLELIYDMSNGKINVFDNAFIKKIMEYIICVHITDNYFLNFADSPPRLNIDPILLCRMGRRLNSDNLIQLGNSLFKGEIDTSNLYQKTYRSTKRLYDDFNFTNYSMPIKDYSLPNLGVMTMRNENLFIGIKGGHNAESHNHNDVGNFVIFANNKPLFIDVGVGEYTRDTFSANRYKIWTMRSSYHNIPDIAGNEQKPGGKYKATDCIFDIENRTFRAELKETYDSPNIISFIREAKMTDVITITDSITLKDKSNISLHLITLYKPEINNNTLYFNSATLEYDKNVSVVIEELCLDDKKLISNWNTNNLYRIHFNAINVKEGTYKFVVTPN